MSEINPGTIEKDTAVDDKESNGKVEDKCPFELITVISERLNRVEQGLRDYQELKKEGYKQKIYLRNEYANKVYVLVRNWSCVLICILAFNAFEILGFHLSDKVIISLIAGVTLHVVAVLIVIMKNLFPRTIENISKNE